jgi:hypothetical protein
VRLKPFEGMSFQKMKLITIGLLYSEDFSEESKVKIYRAITVANSYPVDEQKYRLWESLTKEMWKREDCVEEGFVEYIRVRQQTISDAFDYHLINCKKNKECKLCGAIECARKLEY